VSVEDILKGLVGILEENFPQADKFRPRDIPVGVGKFIYINDEDVDRHDELIEEGTVEFSSDIDGVAVSDLEPIPIAAPVSAVDASSALIGETNRGIISAVRIAIWAQEPGQTAQLHRYGPSLAHFTNSNADFLFNKFQQEIFGMKRGRPPQLYKMTDRLRNFLERLGQRVAASMINKGIVLYDGSLRAATVDTPLKMLGQTIEGAHKQANSVVAIAKYSTLKTSGGNTILDALDGILRPCMKDVHDLVTHKYQMQILGRVQVVKFTPDGFAFRTDVAPTPGNDSATVLRTLMHNATFYNGYPEPLRQAHIHAYFTPDEILTLQNIAVKNYNMEVLRPFDVRRCILAPFGG
jgi:hypothetical protein